VPSHYTEQVTSAGSLLVAWLSKELAFLHVLSHNRGRVHCAEHLCKNTRTRGSRGCRPPCIPLFQFLLPTTAPSNPQTYSQNNLYTKRRCLSRDPQRQICEDISKIPLITSFRTCWLLPTLVFELRDLRRALATCLYTYPRWLSHFLKANRHIFGELSYCSEFLLQLTALRDHPVGAFDCQGPRKLYSHAMVPLWGRNAAPFLEH